MFRAGPGAVPPGGSVWTPAVRTRCGGRGSGKTMIKEETTMKQIGKRILSMLLVFAMAFSLLPAAARAAVGPP